MPFATVPARAALRLAADATTRLPFLPLAVLLLAPPILFGHTHAAAANKQAGINCDVDLGQLALNSEERTLLELLNGYRTSFGLQPLRLSYTLTVNALWKSTDMASRHYAQHNDGFRSWMQRFSDCGYPMANALVGENLAGGYASGAATLGLWEASPLHNANLLDPSYLAVGIKRVQSNDTYGYYWSIELGSILDSDGSSLIGPY
jgi:uncharacterized protein YkwD